MSGTKPKHPFKLGDPLEYRVARLFIHLGYWTRRGREIYTVGGLDTATDLDVLAIRYSDPLRREVQITECKSGGDGPLDRVFWLSGVKSYMEANRATLVRPATRWNIKDFAAEAGVEILDVAHVEGLEHAWAIDPSMWLGISDRDFFAGVEDEWNRGILHDSTTKELYQTLAGEIRFHDPFGGVNFLIHHLRALTRDLGERRSVSESLTRYLLAESASQLSVFLMRIAESSLGLADKDRDGLVWKGMTYGHMDKRVIDRIFRNAKQITGEMIRHHTGREAKIDETFFKMPEPPNIEAIQEMVRMLVRQPHIAMTFSPMTDLLLFERFVKQREGAEWLTKVFPYLDIRDRIKSVQDYFNILRGMDAMPAVALSAKKTPQLEFAGRLTPSDPPREAARDVGVDLDAPRSGSKTESKESANQRDSPGHPPSLFPGRGKTD
jgi:hypothetical protein